MLGTQQEIQILHIDDDPEFTDLTGTLLEREDDRFTVETATSADEGVQLISDRPPDCVVSDYNMPGMDGLEFLQAVREEYPDLPFILFTGRGSEAVASDAISAGVTDYLQKQSGTEQYELLANRIRNAVQARRETQRADRQEQLMRLTEFAGDTGGFEVNVETGDVLLTDGTRRIIGLPDTADLSLEEAIELYHPDDQAEVRRAVTRAAETAEQMRGTWRLQTLESDERLVDVTITPAEDTGDGTTLRGAIHDVTERRERRRKLEQIETLFEHAQDALFLIDVGEEFTAERVNPVWEDALGVTEEQVRGQTPREVLGEEPGAVAEAKFRECVQRQEPLQYEETVRIGAEQRHWVTRIAPVVVDGTVTYIAGATRDITERKERERSLEQQRQRLTVALEGSNAGVWEWEPETDEVVWHESTERLFGLEPGTFEGTYGAFARRVHDDDLQTLEAAIEEAFPSRDPFEAEYRIQTDDDKQLWVRARGEFVDIEGLSPRYIGVITDITERKEHEQDLEQTTEWYRTLLDAAPDAVFVADAETGVIRETNQAATRLLDRPREEIVGMHQTELHPPEKVEEYAELFAEHVSSGAGRDETLGEQVDIYVLDADGEEIPVEINARTVEIGDEHLIQGYFRDIRDRKQRERELEHERKRLETVISNIPVVVFALDPEGVFTLSQGKGLEALGLEPGEVVGQSVFDRYWEYEAQLADIERALDGEQVTGTYEIEGLVLETTLQPVFDDDGTVRAVIGVSIDLTERKLRERELQRKERIIQEMDDGVVVVQDQTITYTNPQISEIIGHPAEELVGEPMGKYIAPEDQETVRRRYRERLAANEPPKTYEISLLTSDEETVPVEITAARVTYGDEPATVSIVRDITDRKERIRELERQNERLDEFASIVSHDLRNPLNVAGSRLELAQETCDSPHLAGIADAHGRMERLIDDLLTLARQGKEVREMESVSVTALAGKCWDVVATAEATLKTDADVTIRADRNRLKQALENLIRNAVEHGGPEVTVWIGDLAAKPGFYVADDGPGIPEDSHDEVLESGYSTAENGTGFGLAIVREIVEAHDWDITVTDSNEGGARFEITGVDTVDW